MTSPIRRSNSFVKEMYVDIFYKQERGEPLTTHPIGCLAIKPVGRGQLRQQMEQTWSSQQPQPTHDQQ